MSRESGEDEDVSKGSVALRSSAAVGEDEEVEEEELFVFTKGLRIPAVASVIQVREEVGGGEEGPVGARGVVRANAKHLKNEATTVYDESR